MNSHSQSIDAAEVAYPHVSPHSSRKSGDSDVFERLRARLSAKLAEAEDSHSQNKVTPKKGAKRASSRGRTPAVASPLAGLPLTFGDSSAFEGASQYILETIEKNGQISQEEFCKVIAHYHTVSDTVRFHFPYARDGKTVLSDVRKILEPMGITAENTLYAQSVCPDEINHELGDITELFRTYLGEVFHLGGLAGIPFTGKTGFAAFSHHVPDGGNLFVLMAPHIGVSDKCLLGKYSRDGQDHDGAACGAACGAYNLCCKAKSFRDLPDLRDPHNAADYQMNFIISEINKPERLNAIQAIEDENGQQAELARQCYEIAKEQLDQVLNTHFGDGHGKLIVLAGIQINMPRPMNDYFQPISFYYMQKDKPSVDLFDKAFL